MRGRVLRVDATRLRLHGGNGNDARLHLAYDLLQGQFAQVRLTDGRGAEKVEPCSLKPHDLRVLDAGYGDRAQLAAIQDPHADAVVRSYPPTFPLPNASGHALDLRTWLDARGCNQRARLAYDTHAGKHDHVRVRAMRRGELGWQAASRRAKARARKRNRPRSARTQYYADGVVLVSTLRDSELWPSGSIWRLYGARWQIELVFKRAKQVRGIGQLRVRTRASAVPLVWALLLVWLLAEGVVKPLREQLQGLAEPHPATYAGQSPQAEAVVRTWGCVQVVVNTLIGAIAGHGSLARVAACLPKLRRFLVSHPRERREHQQSEVGAWLSDHRRTRSRPLCDALC